ncbi:MAG: helix-turn-helix domain-containing protein [Rhodanobacteraceae bacterium]
MQRPPRLPSLRPWIESVWIVASAQSRREHAIASGNMHLAIRIRGPALRIYTDTNDRSGRDVAAAVVAGAHAGFYVKRATPGRIVGAQLKPGASWALFGISAAELSQRHTPLHVFWVTAAHDLETRLSTATESDEQRDLLEQALRSQLRPTCGLHPEVAGALACLDACADVEAALADARCSHRHFVAVFRGATGLAPKRYARIRRFSRVLADAADGATEWSTLALDHGYCDQAHLNRDFREFTGLSPCAWRQAQGKHPHHLPME